MKIYKLVNNICGEKYREFILYCLKHSTFFSFTIRQNISREEIACLDELNNGYAYKTIETYLWYNYKVFIKPLDVILFHSHPEIVDFFEKNFDSIFPGFSNGLEDVCFFDRDKIIFGSVTHEKHAAIFPSDEIQLKNFMRFAEWEEKELTEKDYDFIPDFKKIL